MTNNFAFRHAVRLGLLLKILSLGLLLHWAGFELAGTADAGPLPREAVPEVLKPWIPWVLHGHESAACPASWSDAGDRQCLWPSMLELTPGNKGASFILTVETFGRQTIVPLPGNGEFWPQEVTVDGKPLVVIEREQQPAAILAEGRHTVAGRFIWSEMPSSLPVPRELAMIRVKTDEGWGERQVDESGAIWLRIEAKSADDNEELSVRSFRRIEDGQPLRITSRFELTFAGKAREVVLEQALLPGFVAVSLSSPLPARLGADGSLRLQARPGVYVIEVAGRRMDRLFDLSLPENAGREEIWSWQARRELRTVDIVGATIDPKLAGVPGDWQNLPAYLLHAGETLKLTEQQRGNPEPELDKLMLNRTIWLDGDGGGYTLQDRIGGTISRSWRLEARAPITLGHANVDGIDQYLTKSGPEGETGFEVRHGRANIVADSRIEGSLRTIAAAGWNTSFQGMAAQLNLPPGWLLLHAGGVDHTEGSWLSMWTLWDFFFLLLIALAAWKLRGITVGLMLGGALVLSWHVPGAPGWLWLPTLAVLAAGQALAGHRIARGLHWLQALLAVAIVWQLLSFAVDQARLAIYPALEKTGDFASTPFPQYGVAPAGMPLPAEPAAAPAPMMEGKVNGEDRRLIGSTITTPWQHSSPGTDAVKKDASRPPRYAQDAGTSVQTGPGLPHWRWYSHQLQIQGPIGTEQYIDLWLLPPFVHALLRLLTIGLLLAAFHGVFLRGRKFSWPVANPAPTALAVGILAITTLVAPGHSRAEEMPVPIAPQPGGEPWQKWLDELRTKLLAEPDCMPACAQVPRLLLEADAKTLHLRLEAHAAMAAAIPLPGQAGQLRLRAIALDGRPAGVRRDQDGQLWLNLPSGVHQITMDADIADAVAVNIALPLAPRILESRLTGWSLTGIDARGIPQDALTLNRAAGGGKAATETTRDALPPLVEVERTFNFTDRWTIDTVIRRSAPSMAPIQVTVPLLAGEQVTDSAVRVHDGQALVTLGTSAETRFGSALEIVPHLELRAAAHSHQVEHWRLNADTRWHIRSTGLAPVLHQEGEFWLPQWQPWPGDIVSLDIERPQGAPGPSLTLDSLKLSTTPGARLTEVNASLELRSSLGGSHTVQLPEGIELQSISIDGEPQALRVDQRKLLLPIRPGSQRIDIVWRHAQGISPLQHTANFDAGIAGVNATTELLLGQDRWLLAVGGPRLGPAVLIWGTFLIVLIIAFALARSRLTPLGVGAWILLGLGVAQASVTGALLIAGWFLLLAARGRFGNLLPRWAFNSQQIILFLATLAALAVLFMALQVGLLGSPDMLVTGNGSYDRTLIWYQDRIVGEAPAAWAFSLPMWLYRTLMLLWALWLAAAVLKWVRWGWQQAGTGGFWRRGPINRNRPPLDTDK